MKLRRRLVIFFAIYVFTVTAADQDSFSCNQSCGDGPREKRVVFPFGFSPTCHIQLNCSDNGAMLIGDFTVRTLTARSLLIDLPAKCNRPVGSIHHLFGRNYAPTSRNGILLQNCTSPVSTCVLPETMVQTNFEMLDCNSSIRTNTSCYLEKEADFIDLEKLTKSSSCGSLYSSVSVESFHVAAMSVELEVEVIELEWWLEGECQCSSDAHCTRRLPPFSGTRGFRCQCREGFEGDGYRHGLGCLKASAECNSTSRYCHGTRRRIGFLIGGGGVGACIMACLLIFCCIMRKHVQPNQDDSVRDAISSCGIPVFSYKELKRATNNFCHTRRLGTGAYATVYSGRLQGGAWVAVKRIHHVGAVEQVVNEINLLSAVRHPNLLRLLGCTLEQDEQILVYEFMPNGTLSRHLRRERTDALQWPVRLAIAADTARAVAHLHALSPPIFHRDIKSANVLLDYDFKSKVADFGLSRVGEALETHVSTAPQGTPGYLDPQYHQNFHLSDKSDVYSFGVLLVEIITAMKVVDFTRSPGEVSLAALAVDRIRNRRLEEIIDPVIQRDDWTLWSVHRVAELAFRCLAFEQDARPSMAEVTVELEEIRLSKCGIVEYNAFTASVESLSPRSNFSDDSDRPLGVVVNKKLDSPVCVHDHWLSERSSPSASSLLNNVIQ